MADEMQEPISPPESGLPDTSASSGDEGEADDGYLYEDLLDEEGEYEEDEQDETEESPAADAITDAGMESEEPARNAGDSRAFQSSASSRQSAPQARADYAADEWQSPGAFALDPGQFLTPEMQQVLDTCFDSEQQKILGVLLTEGIKAGLSHYERQEMAQERALESLNLPATVQQEYARDLKAAMRQIPMDQRGTDRAGSVALQLVLYNRTQRSGDLPGEMERMARVLRGQPATPPRTSSKPAPNKPEARPMAPRVQEPGASRPRARRGGIMDDIAELWNLNDLDRAALTPELTRRKR